MSENQIESRNTLIKGYLLFVFLLSFLGLSLIFKMQYSQLLESYGLSLLLIIFLFSFRVAFFIELGLSIYLLFKLKWKNTPERKVLFLPILVLFMTFLTIIMGLVYYYWGYEFIYWDYVANGADLFALVYSFYLLKKGLVKKVI